MSDLDDAAITQTWSELAALVDRLTERIADPHDFAVQVGSSLAGDDNALHPFELSQESLRNTVAHGRPLQTLDAAGVPAAAREVSETDLGEDFSAAEWVEWMYGGGDD